MKTIGIVGSRSRDSGRDLIATRRAFLKVYEKGDIIVSGGCSKGGDRFAEVIAKELGLTIIIHYPDWARIGRGAGFARNSKIADSCNVLLAVIAENSKGTEDTINKTRKQNKSVILIN